MNLYTDKQCPTCGGKITATARMMDDTKAPTFCENKHQFMRSEAVTAGDTLGTPRNKPLVVNASVRLKAAARVQANISKVAEQGIKDITKMMDMRGYQHKMDTKRALYELKFLKDDEVFSLCGWHGDGKYGKEKTILELYDHSHGSKPIVNVPPTDLDDIHQKNVIVDIVDYLKKHA